MTNSHALALRTALLISPADAASMIDATTNGLATTAADAVAFDLASQPPDARASAHQAAAEGIAAVAATRRDVHVRVSAARSGELEGDLSAAVGRQLAAVVLTGAEIPQDVRDADVGIRRFEMQRRTTPGNVRLIPEIDSAAGVAALPAMLKAVDRHSAVALNVDGLHADLGLNGRDGASSPAIDHAMWEVALASRDAGLPWVVAAPAASAEERARLAARAREFGAAGACVASEAEIRGLNALFTPEAAAVEAARATIAEWDDARSHGRPPQDRRALRRAQLLMAQVEAIERRERVR